MRIDKSVLLTAVLGTAIACLAADGSWLKHVPDADRQRINPLAGQTEAIAAGGRYLRIAARNVMGTTPWGEGNDPACAAAECNMPPTAKFSGC